MSQNSTYCIIKVVEELQGIITYKDVIFIAGGKSGRRHSDFSYWFAGGPTRCCSSAKSKFANIVKLLKTVYPDIEEARCRLKIREIQGARKRYEIDSNIISTHAVTSYANSGWDLAKMFDQMSDSLKKKMAHRVTTKQKDPGTGPGQSPNPSVTKEKEFHLKVTNTLRQHLITLKISSGPIKLIIERQAFNQLVSQTSLSTLTNICQCELRRAKTKKGDSESMALSQLKPIFKISKGFERMKPHCYSLNHDLFSHLGL